MGPAGGVFRWGRRGAYPPPKKKKLDPCGRLASVPACTPTPRPAMQVAPVIRTWAAVLVVQIQLFEIKLHSERSFSKSSARRGSSVTRIMASRAPKRRADDQHCLASFFRAKVPASLRHRSRDLHLPIYHSRLDPSLRNHAQTMQCRVDVQSTTNWWTKLCRLGARYPMTRNGSLSMEENSRSVSFLFFIFA